MNFNDYFNELKRRHVIKAGIAYLVVAWLITQVLSIIIPVFEIPNSILKTSIIVMAIVFPLWLIFAWIYDFTPDGLQKTDDVEYDSIIHAKKNLKLNRFIIAGLSVAIILLVINQVRMRNQMTEIKSIKVSGQFDSSIAVMAFADRSPNEDHEYFSDGISEEILNILVGIPNLKVISRTSSFSYKDKDLTATEIGEELKVSHILEGSIRKAGNTVRISAQLINTSDGSQEWSQTFDRNLDSIFKIQDEIAQVVTNKLELTLLPKKAETKRINSEAYTLFLQARHLTYQKTKESYINAELLIKESIALDSTYAPSWCLLSNVYDTGTYNFLTKPISEGIELGIAAARKALELDNEFPGAYLALSSLQYKKWDFSESRYNINKALSLDPGNSEIIGTAALQTLGNLDESIALIKKSISLNPVQYVNYYNLGHNYYLKGELDEAETALNKFALYYPNSAIYHYVKTHILIARGHYEEALAEAQKEPDAFFNLYARNFALFALGNEQQANETLRELIDTYGKTEAANIADIHAFRGEIDEAFFWLNKAIEIKDPVLMAALNFQSFKVLYNDPRWDMIINSIGLPDDHGYYRNKASL